MEPRTLFVIRDTGVMKKGEALWIPSIHLGWPILFMRRFNDITTEKADLFLEQVTLSVYRNSDN